MGGRGAISSKPRKLYDGEKADLMTISDTEKQISNLVSMRNKALNAKVDPMFADIVDFKADAERFQKEIDKQNAFLKRKKEDVAFKQKLADDYHKKYGNLKKGKVDKNFSYANFVKENLAKRGFKGDALDKELKRVLKGG